MPDEQRDKGGLNELEQGKGGLTETDGEVPVFDDQAGKGRCCCILFAILALVLVIVAAGYNYKVKFVNEGVKQHEVSTCEAEYFLTEYIVHEEEKSWVDA